MSYQVHIICDVPCPDLIGDLDIVARTVLENEKASPGDVSIILTSKEKLHELNLRFAQNDRATDVLAFSDGSLDPDTKKIYYGDITIALPIAKQQAETANHSLAAELALLTIHAVLHLLGYNHQDEDERKQMWEKQAKTMEDIGYTFNTSEYEV
jgi:probable rRNA maturation factor